MNRYKIYLGKNTYLSMREAVKYIKDIQNKEPEYKYISIDAEKADPSNIIDTLTSQDLFSTKRIILVKRIYKNKKKEYLIPKLLEYIQSETSDILVIWEDQKVASNTKYIKFFKTNNSIEEVNEFNKRTFLTWAKEEIKNKNINIDSLILKQISEYSNYEPERFVNTIEKITLLDEPNIGKDNIKDIIADTLEEDIWKLIDEVNSENGNPLNILEKILSQKVDPNYILSMIARNIRLIYLIKSVKGKLSNGEIASKLRIPPFTIPSLSHASDKYSFDKLNTLYEKLSSLDYEIKIGRIEPQLGITLFCSIL